MMQTYLLTIFFKFGEQYSVDLETININYQHSIADTTMVVTITTLYNVK
jgi:hypothetical protein